MLVVGVASQHHSALSLAGTGLRDKVLLIIVSDINNNRIGIVNGSKSRRVEDIAKVQGLTTEREVGSC